MIMVTRAVVRFIKDFHGEDLSRPLSVRMFLGKGKKTKVAHDSYHYCVDNTKLRGAAGTQEGRDAILRDLGRP